MVLDGLAAVVRRCTIRLSNIVQNTLIKRAADHRGQLQGMPHLLGQAIDAGSEQRVDVVGDVDLVFATSNPTMTAIILIACPNVNPNVMPLGAGFFLSLN